MWRRKDPRESDAFKTWYYKLLVQRAPVRASSLETSGGVLPVTPVVPPHSLGGQGGQAGRLARCLIQEQPGWAGNGQQDLQV
jgi:hypothetical protein